jgi:hypothetical protein
MNQEEYNALRRIFKAAKREIPASDSPQLGAWLVELGSQLITIGRLAEARRNK